MKQDSIPTKVFGIVLDEENQMPVVILKDLSDDRLFPLNIGPFEASSIIVEMEGVHPPRPLTHDLLANFFNKHHFTPLYFLLYGKFEDEYLAKVKYKKGFRSYTMEVRPSDGISLALRLHIPIYLTPEIACLLNKDNIYFAKLIQNSSNILNFVPENSETASG